MELKEFTINNPDDYIYGELLRGDYNIICFSCYIWNIEQTLYLAENLKKAKPEVMVLLGGPEVTWRSVEIMKKNRSVDFLLAGEGEESLPKLLSVLRKDESSFDFSEIGGLHYRDDDKIYVNPPSKSVDFGALPFPFTNLVPEPDKIIYYESVRGCPYSCSYCISAIEKGIRPLPVNRVKKDLSYFIYKRVKQVKFVDRTFNYDDKRSIEIIRYLMEADNGVTNFHFELCGDIVSKEFLALISQARSGLFQFEIGVQSTNDETLAAINRSCNFEELADNVKEIISMGNIHMHLDLIAGLPYEHYSSFKRSFNDVYGLQPHALQLGFLKLLPGTPIREEAEIYGYEYRKKAPYEVISNKYISATELNKLKMVEKVLNLYYNRGGFKKTLDWLAFSYHDNPFDFYEEFADFYYEKGFQHRSHNKEDLYRILNCYGRNLVELGGCMDFKGDNNILVENNNHDKGLNKYIESLLEEDMNNNLNSEAVRKFMKTGWTLPI